MASHDYKGAIVSYEAAVALDVNDSALTSGYQSGVETARVLLSGAMEAAHGKLVEGESAVAGKDWESGIASFNAGLSIDGLDDEDLKASLDAALESAEASKAACDAAREAAEAHLAEGIQRLSSREYGEAIESLEAGLSEDAQSDELRGRLEASLSSARSGLDAQESARTEARTHASRAEACMASHDYKGAIVSYEAAVALGVNDSALASSYQSGV